MVRGVACVALLLVGCGHARVRSPASPLLDRPAVTGVWDWVFRSNDDGAIWVGVNSGLTNTYVHTLGASGTSLFAATHDFSRTPAVGWVFRTNDNGASWTDVSSGLANKDVRVFAVGGTKLFAGTQGNGVWQYPLN